MYPNSVPNLDILFSLTFVAPCLLPLIQAPHYVTTRTANCSLLLTFHSNVICPTCFPVVHDSTWLQSDGIRAPRAWRLAPLTRAVISLRPLGAAPLFCRIMLLIQT